VAGDTSVFGHRVAYRCLESASLQVGEQDGVALDRGVARARRPLCEPDVEPRGQVDREVQQQIGGQIAAHGAEPLPERDPRRVAVCRAAGRPHRGAAQRLAQRRLSDRARQPRRDRVTALEPQPDAAELHDELPELLSARRRWETFDLGVVLFVAGRARRDEQVRLVFEVVVRLALAQAELGEQRVERRALVAVLRERLGRRLDDVLLPLLGQAKKPVESHWTGGPYTGPMATARLALDAIRPRAPAPRSARTARFALAGRCRSPARPGGAGRKCPERPPRPGPRG